MQKVVIDTNVFVSSLIQQSYPYRIVNELFIEERIALCISESLILEYYEVLRQPKFSVFYDFSAKADALLADIAIKSIMYVPKIKLEILSDKDDNMVLELADACSADYVITGNTKDFTFPACKSTKIVTPKDYRLFYQPYPPDI
ncbi:MAG: putative toxin-antitoxin system toxin component, PIN family [Dysgonamonadaceae bacterium]|jgi:putative PIN family toxin of toxin-antitoxin system|nr:putative toxin-antitoxin system toxin component, PIN family [Dysgonamonadaceae bacterium]